MEIKKEYLWGALLTICVAALVILGMRPELWQYLESMTDGTKAIAVVFMLGLIFYFVVPAIKQAWKD